MRRMIARLGDLARRFAGGSREAAEPCSPEDVARMVERLVGPMTDDARFSGRGYMVLLQHFVDMTRKIPDERMAPYHAAFDAAAARHLEFRPLGRPDAKTDGEAGERVGPPSGPENEDPLDEERLVARVLGEAMQPFDGTFDGTPRAAASAARTARAIARRATAELALPAARRRAVLRRVDMRIEAEQAGLIFDD